MAFNVISFIEIANNTQTLKIIDFTCKLGFGPSKSTYSTVTTVMKIWELKFGHKAKFF